MPRQIVKRSDELLSDVGVKGIDRRVVDGQHANSVIDRAMNELRHRCTSLPGLVLAERLASPAFPNT